MIAWEIPIKWRRHYKLLPTFLILIVGTVVFFWSARIAIERMDDESGALDESSALDESGTLDESGALFDVIFHEVQIEIDPEDYEAMILDYTENGGKEDYPATITIDGVTIENVGIRFKGNSSLMGAIDTGRGFTSEYFDVPFLIKFDEYVDDQNYLGYTQLALRAQFNDPTAMHEVLAYEILEEMGVIAPKSVYATVNLNGEGENLYMITEAITDEFLVSHLGADEENLGDLYKVSGGWKMAYKSTNPLDYSNYELKTNEDESDMASLIELFKFIDESSDDEFVEELEEYLDLESMIEYLAFCNVLVNLDSFPGNGNNYYLYQNPETEQFILIPWDINETFGRFAMNGSATGLGLFYENDGGEFFKGPERGGQGQFSPGGQGQNNFGGGPDGGGPGEGDPGGGGQGGGGFTWGAAMSQISEMSPLMERIFDIDELKDEYISAITSLLENEFEENKIFKRVAEIEELLLEKNEEYGFWEDEELAQFEDGVLELKEFVTDRIEFLKEAIEALN